MGNTCCVTRKATTVKMTMDQWEAMVSLEDGDERNAKLMETFKRLDTDGNGWIDRDEMDTFIINLEGLSKRGVDERLLDKTWSLFDISKNGKVSYDEFYKRAASLRRVKAKTPQRSTTLSLEGTQRSYSLRDE